MRDVEIPVSGASVPAPLKRIELDVQVGGQIEHTEYPPQTNLTHTFHWNGLDIYGRAAVGTVPGVDTITYVYDAVYRSPAQLTEAFSRFGDALSPVKTRKEVKITQSSEFTVIGKQAVPPAFLGGWTLNVHHALDPVSKVVELGSGDDMASPVQNVARRLANPLEEVTYPDSRNIKGVTWQPDGSAWFLDVLYTINDNQSTMRVRRVAPDGTVSTVATLPKASPGKGFGQTGISPAPNGGAWVLTTNSSTTKGILWKVEPNGTVNQVTAGDLDMTQSVTPNGGDGTPASQVLLDAPEAIDSAPDGTVYIASLPRIQRINAKGVLETFYTSGVGPGEGNFGTDTFAVGPDSSLYVVHIISGARVIDRVLPSGKVERIVGGGSSNCCNTGQVANQVKYNYYGPVAVGDDGRVVFNDGRYLNAVRGDGTLERLAGTSGEPGSSSPDGASALSVDFTNSSATHMDIGPDGRIVVATNNAGLRTVEPGIPGFALSGYTVPSRDGRELYRFDSNGRHTETLDAITGVPIWRFAYDSAGRLETITDRDDRVTTIERDAGGKPTAIVSPTGERTTLGLDGSGNLATGSAPGPLGHPARIQERRPADQRDRRLRRRPQIRIRRQRLRQRRHRSRRGEDHGLLRTGQQRPGSDADQSAGPQNVLPQWRRRGQRLDPDRHLTLRGADADQNRPRRHRHRDPRRWPHEHGHAITRPSLRLARVLPGGHRDQRAVEPDLPSHPQPRNVAHRLEKSIQHQRIQGPLPARHADVDDANLRGLDPNPDRDRRGRQAGGRAVRRQGSRHLAPGRRG